MKNLLAFLAILTSTVTFGQFNFNDILASGINDAERFSNAYLTPVTEAAMYSIANGWYNTADSKPLGGFEISIIGNITSFRNNEESQAFTLNTTDFENLQFVDGSSSRLVSTALGDIEGVRVFVEDEAGLVRQEFELPTGLSSENLNFVPSGFIQASLGLVKGLEVKARFLPTITTDEVSIDLFGAGLQYDFTKILPADKLLPIAIAAVIGYTNLNGEYDLENTGAISGENQRLDASFNTWNFSAVVSTRKIPIINFYGGLGYITGNSTVDVLGDYQVTAGPLQNTFTDPFSVSSTIDGVTATVGTKIKLGFFRINVDYTAAEFSTLTAAINFGFR